MKKSPWEELPNVWATEAKFWAWVRGVLRKGWSRHPIRTEFIRNNRKKIPNPNKKGKKTIWGMRCRRCEKDLPQSHFDINHKEPSGSMKSKEDFLLFCTKMFFICFEDLEPLCRPCHKVINHSQRKGISEEEAAVEKRCIKFMKDTTTNEQKKFLIKAGYTEDEVSNAKKRRSLLEDHFMRNE